MYSFNPVDLLTYFCGHMLNIDKISYLIFQIFCIYTINIISMSMQYEIKGPNEKELYVIVLKAALILVYLFSLSQSIFTSKL